MVEDFFDSTFGVILSVLLFVGIILGILIVGVRQIDYHNISINCPKQAIAYNRETKFVAYNYWSYECLVKSNNGTYVNISNLINNVQN